MDTFTPTAALRQQMDALEEVMELPDTDLADWLTGRRPIPPLAEFARTLPRARLAAARSAGGGHWGRVVTLCW